MSFGDDPAKVTWFGGMQCLAETARQLDLPVAVHTGAAEGCKQAMRAGVRSLEHCYLIDDEVIAMAEQSGAFIVHEGWEIADAGNLEVSPRRGRDRARAEAHCDEQGTCVVWNRLRHVPVQSRHTRVSSDGGGGVDAAPGTESRNECSGKPVGAGRYWCTCTGKHADIVAMSGDPVANIAATENVDFMRAGRIYRHQAFDFFQS